jgi:hypothetical protein
MQIDLGQGWEGRLSARGANSGRQGPTEAEGLNQLGRRYQLFGAPQTGLRGFSRTRKTGRTEHGYAFSAVGEMPCYVRGCPSLDTEPKILPGQATRL